MRVRREKRARLLTEGRDPYPVSVPRTTTLRAVHEAHPDLAAGQETDEVVSVAGRVVFVRTTGKLAFATLQEGDGTRLQVMLSLAEVGEEALERWKSDVDLGDHVSATGRVVASRRGELSVMAREWQLAAKALRPLPVLHRETSEETRVRQRYADLIVRPEARRVLRTRAAVVRSLRETFHARGYLELETPILQTLHGGASARPFVTRSNALGTDLYLRIATELHLKRAVVGGVEKAFEIGRIFRNEGVDSTHSPEFSTVEFYEAYADYDTMADLTRELVQTAARDALGSTTVVLADGSEYDLGGRWEQLGLYDSLSGALGEEVTPDTPLPVLRAHAQRLAVDLPPSAGHGKHVEELWEHLVSPGLHAPAFVRGFPVETSPLTKSDPSSPRVVEKWDLYVRGLELGTGYSELNDPVVQRERLEAQARLAGAGDDEAMPLDEDFLRALEYGMPPTGGVGFGIDRLLMVLTGLGIRETILFPLVRPER
ncbi:lysine--tRNA ligase [Quadrisphaera sp. DSM 44207]|uniref:lysine--tRNA ligase n=1 Tax=Quadrisphaera sp. DSM 44207 TaxID=1881057 RepID=UPI000B856FF6